MAKKNNRGKELREKVQKHPDGTKEYWRDVPEYEGFYRVSDKGRVKSVDRIVKDKNSWSKRKGRIIKHGYEGGGYPFLFLWKNGKGKKFKVSHLVLFAFVSPKPEGMQCCHFPDRDVTNNKLENLQWNTPKVNSKHCLIHGTHLFLRLDRVGDKNGNAKLDKEKVREIRELYAAKKWRQIDLAEKFGVTQRTISAIIKRRLWPHIT